MIPHARFARFGISLATAVAVTTGLAVPFASAKDWPQWGGNDPGRNMYSPATGLPDQFEPGEYQRGTER
jgi:hypothetical protein